MAQRGCSASWTECPQSTRSWRPGRGRARTCAQERQGGVGPEDRPLRVRFPRRGLAGSTHPSRLDPERLPSQRPDTGRAGAGGSWCPTCETSSTSCPGAPRWGQVTSAKAAEVTGSDVTAAPFLPWSSDFFHETISEMLSAFTAKLTCFDP